MATICKLHPLSPEHVAKLSMLVWDAIEAGRRNLDITQDDMAELFKLREVLATMQRKPEAKKSRRRPSTQTSLPVIEPVVTSDDQESDAS